MRILQRLVNWIKTRISKRLLEEFYSEVEKITPDIVQEGRYIRKIDIIFLKCGHIFWQDRDKLDKYSPHICDSCLLDAAIARWGDKGQKRFSRWWEKGLKVR